MEETPEGLATAAATREAAKRKRAELEAQGVIDDQPAVKKTVVPPQAISHEVALPEHYVCEADSQPELYGMKIPESLVDSESAIQVSCLQLQQKLF